MSAIWAFDGEDFMRKICESLRKHTMKIINFEKKKILSLINKEYK